MGPAERIAILEQKLRGMQKMSQKRQSGARVGARRASKRQRCQFCRFPGYEKRDCLKRMLANGEITREEHEDRLRLVRAGYNTGIRDSQEVAMTSEAPSIPALLHTPIFVNGTKLDRGIIDIGARANIMPLSVVTKHGWSFQRSQIEAIRMYNRDTAPVAGVLKRSLKFGPMKEVEDVGFLVAGG